MYILEPRLNSIDRQERQQSDYIDYYESVEWLTPPISIDTQERQQTGYGSSEWLTPLNSIDTQERQQSGHGSSEWLTPLNSVDTQDRQHSYYESEEWLKSQPQTIPSDDRLRKFHSLLLAAVLASLGVAGLAYLYPGQQDLGVRVAIQ